MIRKIILENFMSHGRTEIDLAEGLTVLTGPNNCGKSALVAALQTVAGNGKTTHVMRHGTKLCQITIQTDDDHEVIWQRKGKTVKYQINGEDVHRIGQGIPDGLHDVLRLDRVTTEIGATTNDYDIHFGHQKSPVFLLDESGSRAAAFFASSSDAARLIKMQGTHRQRVQNSKKEAKRLRAEIETVAAKLQTLSPVNAIAEQVAAAETKSEQLQHDENRIAKLKTSIAQIQVARTQQAHSAKVLTACQQIESTPVTPESMQQQADRCERLRSGIEVTRKTMVARDRATAVCKAMLQLCPVAEPRTTKPLSELIARLTQNHRQLAKATAVRNGCQDLRPLPEMHPADRCQKLMAELARSQSACQRNESIAAAVEPLAEPPHPKSVESLKALMKRLRQAESQRHQNQARFESFKDLPPVPTPGETLPLKRMIDQLMPQVKAVASARKSAAKTLAALQEQETRIRDFVNEDPTCQTCGGKIDPETLMSTLPDLNQHAHPPEPMS